MNSRNIRMLCLCLAVAGFFAMAGCGGGGGGDSSNVAAPVTTTPTTSGNVTVSGSVNDAVTVNSSIRGVVRADTSKFEGATVSGIYYDSNGLPQNTASATVSSGTFTLKGCPDSTNNIFLYVKIGSSQLRGLISTTSSSTVSAMIDKVTDAQVDIALQSIDNTNKTKTPDTSVLLSLIPPETLAGLTADQRTKLSEKLKDREKAILKIMGDYGVSSDKAKLLRDAGFQILQDIQAGLRDSTSPYYGDWKKGMEVYAERIKAVAFGLGIAADALAALQVVDSDSFGADVTSIVTSGTTDATLVDKMKKLSSSKKLSDLASGILAALKEFRTLGSKTLFTDDEITGFDNALTNLLQTLKETKDVKTIKDFLATDPSGQLVGQAITTIYKALKLFEGNPPLISKFGPNKSDFDAESLSWVPVDMRPGFDPSTPPVADTERPTAEQVQAFSAAVKKIIGKKLSDNLSAAGLTDGQKAALVFLFTRLGELGFRPHDFSGGQVPGQGPSTNASGTQVAGPPNGFWGIVRKLSSSVSLKGQTYDFSIEPPPGMPKTQFDGNLLAYLRADTGVTLAEDTQSAVNVMGNVEAFPSKTTAAGFLVTKVQKPDATKSFQPPAFSDQTVAGMLGKVGSDFYLGYYDQTQTFVANLFLVISDPSISSQIEAILLKAVYQRGAKVTGQPAPFDQSKGEKPKIKVSLIAVDDRALAPPPPASGTVQLPKPPVGSDTLHLPTGTPTPTPTTTPTPKPTPPASDTHPIATGTPTPPPTPTASPTQTPTPTPTPTPTASPTATPTPTPTPTSTGTTTLQPISVGMAGSLFQPASISNAKVGQTVLWVNNDSVSHTVTSDQAGLFDSSTIAPGGKFEKTFANAGTFSYHCNFHAGMRGSITVIP